MAAQIYKNLIGGEWVASRTGQTLQNLTPADTRDVVGVFQRSDSRDIDDAVAAAKQAWEQWRLMPAPKRAEIIFRCGEILQQRKEEYSQLMTREMGKVLRETRGDVQEAIDTAYYMAGEGRRLFGATVPSELPNKFAMAVRTPIGVCGMIAPWNFPMAIPSWKIFPALLCGNTMILKPSSLTPDSARHLVEVLQEAGIPEGVVNLVYGSGASARIWLTDHPRVDLVSFTRRSCV